MDDDQATDARVEEAPQGSVFGNLPGSRPGSRSPRRAGGSEAAERPEPKIEAPAPEPQPARVQPSPEAQPEPEPEPERAGGIEDVAWAGVAAAAEAATLGVRLANRALETLRDAVDKR